jgi:hypothetical protein
LRTASRSAQTRSGRRPCQTTSGCRWRSIVLRSRRRRASIHPIRTSSRLSLRRLTERPGRWRFGHTWLTDGRARRARSSRCRREARADVARGLRSSRIPSHRRTVPARWAGGSATRASDDSAARAAPISPHRTPPPRGRDHREGHDSHAARDHGTARLPQKEGSRGRRRRQGPDPGTDVHSAQIRSLRHMGETLVRAGKEERLALGIACRGGRSSQP